MARISARPLCERLLRRLEQSAYRALHNGDRRLSENYDLAWHVIYQAFFKRSQDPLAAAVAHLQLQFPNPQPRAAVLQFPIPPIPAPQPWIVDGRNGRQWTDAVIAYLEWRSGTAWRRATDRFLPEREIYVAAINLINQARYNPDPPPAAQKKPAAAVRSFAAAA